MLPRCRHMRPPIRFRPPLLRPHRSRQFSTQQQQQQQQRARQVLSGIQPTGTLHLGNYLCAIKQWLTEQTAFKHQSPHPVQHSQTAPRSDHNNVDHVDKLVVRKPIFSIVDLHAITVKHDPARLRQQCLHITAQLLACGIDPDASTLFIQSHVRAHSELQWILSCTTPHTWLNKMTQYKDKSSKLKQSDSASSITLGLYSYPVLQAADILLYGTTHVPVGDDQIQHIELTRDIAEQFNKSFRHHHHDTDIFTVPSTQLISSQSNRVMSLKNGLMKMSKSDANDMSRINLTDTDDQIAQKIKRAKSDSIDGALTYDLTNRPDVSNLLNIYALVTGQRVNDVLANGQINHSKEQFKRALTDVLITTIAPIRSATQRYEADVPYIESVWRRGRDEANEIAERTLPRAKTSIGLPAISI